MKIAIDISQIIYGTGVSVYLRNLSICLLKRYPEDHYLLFGGSLRRRNELMRFASRLKTDSKIYSLPPLLTDFLWNSLHVFPIENLIGNADLVHTSDWAEPPSRLPKVTTVHDLVALKYPQTVAPNVIRAHKKRLAWVIRESTLIIAVSQSTKNDLMNLLKVPQEKIKVVYEGVEPFFCPQPPANIEQVKKKYHLKNDYLFSLSTIEPRKNQLRLVKAFKLIKNIYPNLKLVIAGRTGWGKSINHSHDVILPGFVPDADLPALFSGSLAFVFPSLYEGFGLPVLQAMASGTPVVAANTSSLPEVVGRAGVLIDPKSVRDIAQGIITALARRQELIEVGLRRAKLFTWDETADQTHAIYQSVLNEDT